MPKANKGPITITVHGPETEEGLKELSRSQGSVMIDIMEKQLGEGMTAKIFEMIKKLAEEG